METGWAFHYAIMTIEVVIMDNNNIRFDKNGNVVAKDCDLKYNNENGKYDKIYYEEEVLSARQVEAVKLIIKTMKDNGELY